jgi:flagellar assembly protein FliH
LPDAEERRKSLSEVIKIAGRLGRLHVSTSPARRAWEPLSDHTDPEVAPSPEANVLPRLEVEEMLQAEYRRGRSDGIREARATVAEEVEKSLTEDRRRNADIVGSLNAELESLVKRLEQEAFRFAVAVAEKIVKREIAFDEEVVVRQVQEAIRRVIGVETVRLRVNPRDEAVVRAQKAFLQAGAQSLREIVIEADEKIERGGCILETPSGTVDARVYTQLEQIEAALFGQVVS